MTSSSTDHEPITDQETIIAEVPPPSMSVDASGLNCPLPILRAKKALATMRSGEVLRVVATDPGSKQDFRAFCEQTGNALLAQMDAGDVSVFFIRRR